MPNRSTGDVTLRDDIAGFTANTFFSLCDIIQCFERDNIEFAIGLLDTLKLNEKVAALIVDRAEVREFYIQKHETTLDASQTYMVIESGEITNIHRYNGMLRDYMGTRHSSGGHGGSIPGKLETLHVHAGLLRQRISRVAGGRARDLPGSLVLKLQKRIEAHEEFKRKDLDYAMSYDRARRRATKKKPSPPPRSVLESIRNTYIDILGLIDSLGPLIPPVKGPGACHGRSNDSAPAVSEFKRGLPAPRDEGHGGYVQRVMWKDQAEPEPPIPLAMDPDPHHGRSSDSAPADSGNKAPACLVSETPRPDLVTLDQAARIVHKTKRTLERRKTKGDLPEPVVEGGGGQTALYAWPTMRLWLEANFNMVLPATFPANRYLTDT